MSFHSTHITAHKLSLQSISLQSISLRWITRLTLPFVVLALVLSTTGCSVVMGILGPSEADITGVEPEPTARLLVPTPIGQQTTSAADPALRNGPTPTPFVMRPATQSPPTVSYTGNNNATSIVQQSKMQVTISGDSVNMRNAPGLDTRVLASLPRGTAFEYVDEDATGEWIQVCCVENQLAWVYADLVTIAQNAIAENASSLVNQATVNTSIVAQTTENSAITSVDTGGVRNSNAGTGVQRLAQTLTTENRASSLEQVLSSGPTRFTSEEAAFTITLPAGWLPLADSSKVIQSSIDAIEGKNPEMAALLTEQLSLIDEIPIALIAFDLSPETLDRGFATNVNVMRQPVPAGFPLSYLVQFSADQLESVLGLSDAAEQTEIVLPAGEAIILDYQLNNQAIARQYYLLHDQNLFIATFSASASLAESSTTLFNEIMQSFSFN